MISFPPQSFSLSPFPRTSLHPKSSTAILYKRLQHGSDIEAASPSKRRALLSLFLSLTHRYCNPQLRELVAIEESCLFFIHFSPSPTLPRSPPPTTKVSTSPPSLVSFLCVVYLLCRVCNRHRNCQHQKRQLKSLVYCYLFVYLLLHSDNSAVGQKEIGSRCVSANVICLLFSRHHDHHNLTSRTSSSSSKCRPAFGA